MENKIRTPKITFLNLSQIDFCKMVTVTASRDRDRDCDQIARDRDQIVRDRDLTVKNFDIKSLIFVEKIKVLIDLRIFFVLLQGKFTKSI